jgi:hypothetical protein
MVGLNLPKILTCEDEWKICGNEAEGITSFLV